jgi:hypothetical protein
MIPLADCIDGHVYRINSRNLAYGAFREETGGFMGVREKFSNLYLFEEYHYEAPSFATVQPEEDLGLLPGDIEITYDSKDLFNYLIDIDPAMAYCTACNKIVMLLVPWEDEPYWSHVGAWNRGRMDDDADHPASPATSTFLLDTKEI